MTDILDIFGSGLNPVPQFQLSLPERDWSYYDFASNREAFVRGQKDARPYIEGGCYYRLRGRTKMKYTLLAFNDAQEAWEQLNARAKAGDNVQAVNFTYPRPTDLPVKTSHDEFYTENFSQQTRSDGMAATKLRNAWVEGMTFRPPTTQEAMFIFDEWVAWAKTRHFMVFKGHYLEWIRRHQEGESAGTRLLGYFKDGRPVGMFGSETTNGVSTIVVAKHLAELKPLVLWVKGLTDLGDGLILCGSTADEFKHRMGLSQRESWTFDLSSLKQKPDPEGE